MKQETARPDNQQEVLPIITPEAWLPAILEHIPAEVSFENIGYFTPSSKRIKGITTKEKVVAERTNPDGTAAVLTVQIIGTGKYGLPTTSELDYYRALPEILDEITDQTARFLNQSACPQRNSYATLESRQMRAHSKRSKIGYADVTSRLSRASSIKQRKGIMSK